MTPGTGRHAAITSSRRTKPRPVPSRPPLPHTPPAGRQDRRAHTLASDREL